MAIVCGVDFSSSSRDTVGVAAAFASVLGEPLVLAHALGDVPYLVDAVTRRAHREQASRKLEGLAVEVAPADFRERVRPEVLEGGAHRALVSFAHEAHATLLVVGSHGHGGGARLGLGTTAERCALHAPVPVLVVREAAPFLRWAAGRQPLRAVVCVDPFGAPAAGLGWLRRLRAAAPCDVTAAHAYHPDEVQERWGEPPGSSLVEPDGELERRLADEVRAAIGELPGLGRFTIVVKLALTRPVEPLVALGIAGGAELMVVGTNPHHRHGPPRPWSVAAGVIRLSPVSVAAVPGTAA